MTEDAIELSHVDVDTRVSPRTSSMFSSFCNRESEEKFAEPLHTNGVRERIDQQKLGADEEYEAIILRTVEFLFEESLVESELLNSFARGGFAILDGVELAERRA